MSYGCHTYVRSIDVSQRNNNVRNILSEIYCQNYFVRSTCTYCQVLTQTPSGISGTIHKELRRKESHSSSEIHTKTHSPSNTNERRLN